MDTNTDPTHVPVFPNIFSHLVTVRRSHICQRANYVGTNVRQIPIVCEDLLTTEGRYYEAIDDYGWGRDEVGLFEKATKTDHPDEDEGFSRW